MSNSTWTFFSLNLENRRQEMRYLAYGQCDQDSEPLCDIYRLVLWKVKEWFDNFTAEMMKSRKSSVGQQSEPFKTILYDEKSNPFKTHFWIFNYPLFFFLIIKNLVSVFNACTWVLSIARLSVAIKHPLNITGSQSGASPKDSFTARTAF